MDSTGNHSDNVDEAGLHTFLLLCLEGFNVTGEMRYIQISVQAIEAHLRSASPRFLQGIAAYLNFQEPISDDACVKLIEGMGEITPPSVATIRLTHEFLREPINHLAIQADNANVIRLGDGLTAVSLLLFFASSLEDIQPDTPRHRVESIVTRTRCRINLLLTLVAPYN